MSTYLQLINRVLTAVGQGDDVVAGPVSDIYQLKIAQFVNDFLEEVEGAAPWRVLRSRVSATVAALGNSIALSGTNACSELWYEVNQKNRKLVPICFDVTDTNNQVLLTEMDLATLLRMDQQNSNVTYSTRPSHFAIEKNTSGLTLYVHPRQTNSCDIEVDILIPQARLDPTSGTDLAIDIKVPNMPIQYGASWWAQEDRGEELGVRGDKAEMRFRSLLSDAVSKEMTEQGYDELVVS